MKIYLKNVKIYLPTKYAYLLKIFVLFNEIILYEVLLNKIFNKTFYNFLVKYLYKEIVLTL